MTYTREQMVYKDYKWTAVADHEDPNFIFKQEASMLNRSEGYEMLYFINALAKKWEWKNISVVSYNNLERIIRNQVPSNIRTHVGIKRWIELNHNKI